MPENLDLSGALDAIKEMLNNDEDGNMIRNITSMFSGSDTPSQQSSAPNIDIDTMLKLQRVMSVVQNGAESKHAVFLQTLAPLLKPERREAVSNAVKFLSVSRAIKAMREAEGI